MEENKNGVRLTMRYWLEEALNSGDFDGVEWTDKEAGKFRVPWKHASRNGWDIDRDASIFKTWAIYTGRYTKDTNSLSDKEKKSLARHWKANFRCALNALDDIEVVHQEGVTKGKDAYRVFRLLPQVKPKNYVTLMRTSPTSYGDHSKEDKDKEAQNVKHE